jgi:hypothetical protein
MAINRNDFLTIVVMFDVSVRVPIYKVAVRYTQYILLRGTTGAVMNCMYCVLTGEQEDGNTTGRYHEQ